MCIPHKICKAGEWTKAAGTSVTDTTCMPCKVGTFREKAPTNTDAEQQWRVCKPTQRRTWEASRHNTQCDTQAGEVKLLGRKSATLDKCKESCENSAGCRSITFFDKGWCVHFSTACVFTRTKSNAVSAVRVLDNASHLKGGNVFTVERAIEHHDDVSFARKIDEFWFFLFLSGVFFFFMW